jgi:hypothetical protein
MSQRTAVLLGVLYLVSLLTDSSPIRVDLVLMATFTYLTQTVLARTMVAMVQLLSTILLQEPGPTSIHIPVHTLVMAVWLSMPRILKLS